MRAYLAMKVLVSVVATLSLCNAQNETSRTAQVLDVCTASQLGTKDAITVRGTGRITPDGFVIGDRTCPVARTPSDELPNLILVEISSFSSNSDRESFKKLHTSRYGVSDPVQALVQGDLKCQANFRFRTSDDGDIVSGNGYGSSGLFKCKIVMTQVLVLRSLD